MKNLLFLPAVALSLVLVPAGVTGIGSRRAAEAETTAAIGDVGPAAADRTADGEEAIAVFMPQTDRAETLSMRDYVIGCVAAEMPAAYEPEALKAQAAASATLARYMRAHNTDNAALKGGVIAADPGSYQGYLDNGALRERWGDSFDAYYKKIADAVDEALPYVITCAGEPIEAAFHAVSSGRTENAEVIWGKAEPYLVSVESEGDRLSPGYASGETVAPEAFCEKLGLSPGDTPPEDWLGDAEYTPAGTLTEISVCGKTFTGLGLRRAFSLRSPAVRLRFDGEDFVFSVTGYGHGVGMSQYGADYYARQGMTWREILAHYYPGTELTLYA